MGLCTVVAGVCRLEDVGASASKEYGLEKAMGKMMSDWKDICFNFIPYRDTVCLYLVTLHLHMYTVMIYVAYSLLE